MSNRLDKEREQALQPGRMEFAKKQIEDLGYDVDQISHAELQFLFKGKVVRFWPYSGYHSGKTITDGRGLHKLLKQIMP